MRLPSSAAGEVTSATASPDIRPGPATALRRGERHHRLRFFSSTDEGIQCCFPTLQRHLQHGLQYEREESRVRRMAKRRGYRLVKSRSRDPQAVDYDLYAVIDM